MNEQATEQEIKDVSTAPRVTPEYMESRIADEKYTVDGTLTICILTLDNGIRFVGHSACVNGANFDKAIGEKIARANAFNEMWLPFGFMLAENGGLK